MTSRALKRHTVDVEVALSNEPESWELDLLLPILRELLAQVAVNDATHEDK